MTLDLIIALLTVWLLRALGMLALGVLIVVGFVLVRPWVYTITNG